MADEKEITGKVPHYLSYPRFLWRALVESTEGNRWFYVWMTFLTALALVGANAWAHQVADGMILTHMTDHVSWGLYIANFTFLVGVAAGGVMMVIPAYLYDDREMHDVVIIGEILAIAALIMALLFVVADLGRPDRFWHLIPGLGEFNFPMSMLSWDVIVLNGYLLLNLHIVGYLLYKRYRGEKPDTRWYIPFVFLSIAWAISIHTVTAFLYSGIGGRYFWNTAILAPRFIASAFVTGPVFIIVSLQLVKRFTKLPIPEGPIQTLISVVKVSILVNLFLLGAELFTEFYTGGSHAKSATYLFFGYDGHTGLVPWIWTAIILTLISAVMFLHPLARKNFAFLNAACILAFAGLWIEKGMGLIIPGFIPSPLGEIVEYSPSLVEWQVTVGVWAFGLMIYTVALKIAIRIITGESNLHAELGTTDGEA